MFLTISLICPICIYRPSCRS